MKYCYDYPRPMVTVDCIILRQNSDLFEILLIERKKPPFEGYWALPGGFVDINEELDDACKREIKEETNLELTKIFQFKTVGTIGRDPRGRTITIVYYSIIDFETSETAQASDDAANLRWFNINQLPPMAFDHNVIVSDFLRSLQELKSKFFENT